MTKEEKKKKRILRAQRRGAKNVERNLHRIIRNGGLDCPFDVDMNGIYGSCNCNHENYNSCLGDI